MGWAYFTVCRILTATPSASEDDANKTCKLPFWIMTCVGARFKLRRKLEIDLRLLAGNEETGK